MTRQEPVRPTDVRCTPTVTTTETPMTQQELELIIDRTDPRGPPDAPPWRVVREDDFQAMTAALARLIAENETLNRGLDDALESCDLYLRVIGVLDAVRDALGNGADEDVWPPGLTIPQAVARLRGERPAVVAFLRETLATSETAHASDDLDYVIDIIERGAHRREEGS